MNAPVDSSGLQRDIEVLRQRLEEAEDIQRAITMGEVDAFVVGPTDEDKKVLLLAGAYSRYRQLIEELHQGTVTLSRGGDVLFANQRFARMLDVPLGELYRVPLESHLHPADRERVRALLDSPIGEDVVEVRLLRRDGRQVAAKMSLVSSWDDYATLVVGDVAHGEFVEEAQETVEAIRRGEVDAFVVGSEAVRTLGLSEHPYTVLADRIHQGAATVSATGTVVYANARLCKMLAMPQQRILGTPFVQLALQAHRSDLAALLAGARADSVQREVRLRRSDGGAVPALVTVATLADGQRMCLITDLTEQKRHQASDARTRSLLGVLAHEFRNMLGPIRNAVDLLKLADLDEPNKQAVASIDRQTARMAQLVEDLRAVNPKE